MYGVAMGGTLSMTLADCFVNKMEKDVVISLSRSSIVDMQMTFITEETKINLTSYLKG